MNKIIRIWNQNRGKIIITALIVAFFFIIIRALNDSALKASKERKNKVNETIVEEDMPTQSIITGEKVNVEKTKTNVNLIEDFVEKCNSNDIDNAYALLSEGCKETLFPTKERFIKDYYNVIFTENRTTNIENYKNSTKTNTYKVTFYGDVLGAGSISSKDYYQDYITVEKESKKLNINSLIITNEINQKVEQNGIIITVAKQKIYIDYEIYEIRVQNNTNKDICLDTRKNSKSVYATGTDNVKYTAYTNEISSDLYEITAYGSKTYRLKFNKKYNASIATKKITFTDVVEDYQKYKNENGTERLKLEVAW